MAVPVMARAGSAAADDRPLPDVTCGDTFCPPPPLLGTLDRGLTKATPEQVKSLRNLEADAVDDVIRIHGLSGSDTNAVLTWGRSEAQAQLFTRLLNALDEDEDDRSDDQQNAVDWMTTMMHRKAVAAAVAAGREYVTWAGLNQIRFEALLNANASESDLREFLDDTPQNYNNPDTAAATSGYCKYRSPAPYGSEYTGYNDPTCFARCSSILGCNPPTPSYDQFVKWGEAAASYSLLNSEQFARSVAKIGMVMGLAVAVGTAAAVGALVPAALVGSTAAAIFPYAGLVSYTTGVVWVGFGAAALATVVGIIIVAVVIAVMQGMIVINAAELPGQLAELIVDARTDAPGRGRVDRHDRRDDHVDGPVRVGDVARAAGRVLRQLVHDPGQHQARGSLRQPLMDSVSQSHRDPGGDAVRPAVPDQGGRRDHGNAVTDDHVPGPRGDDGHGEVARRLVHPRTDRLVRRADARDRVHRLERQEAAGLAVGEPRRRPGVRQPRRHKRPDRRLGGLSGRRAVLRERVAGVPQPGRQEDVRHGGAVEAGGGSAELRRHTRRAQSDVVRRQRVRADRRHGRGQLRVALRGRHPARNRACS